MRGRFKEDGINGGEVSWTLAHVPTEASARMVFPELSPKAALTAYWDAIFRMTFADQKDCLERWEQIDSDLHTRRRNLDTLGITELHILSQSGTDLKVGLNDKARWLGGSKKTLDGRKYIANIPTFENFTTPDCRTVNGVVVASRPISINSSSVEGLTMTFNNGELTAWDAKSGKAAFVALIDADKGARRVGEIALVGLGSPVAKQKRVFHSTLYDENAACHIALGNAYTMCVEGGRDMSPTELDAIGCNRSKKHEDIMISDEYTRVIARTREGLNEVLIASGFWKGSWRTKSGV
jgi:aminopeptidase